MTGIEIVVQHGWTGASLVGKDAVHAAWLIVQHTDSDRDFTTASAGRKWWIG
jgi:hypothetical protein